MRRCVSGPAAGLCVTGVISMVTEQHGASHGSALRALGSHEKIDFHSKQRGRYQGLWMHALRPRGVLVVKSQFA